MEYYIERKGYNEQIKCNTRRDRMKFVHYFFIRRQNEWIVVQGEYINELNEWINSMEWLNVT